MASSVTTSQPLYSHRGIITVCAMLATLMQALDSTIANVALPYIQGSLATAPDQVTWVLTSYIVAAAIMTAPVGWLSARFGRKPLFLVCLAGFTVGSMLCGIAETLTQMVLFRLLQGAFGAGLVPLSQATMLDLYPAEQRGSAMAMWGMGVMVGPIIGPTLGGYLTDVYDWRWVFYINLPFGLLAIAGLWLFLHDGQRKRTSTFDWIGFGVLSIGIAGLQLMLDRGEQKDWFGSTEIVIETTLAGLGLYLFVVHVILAERRFIPSRIFRDLNFSAGLLVMSAIRMVLLASSALLAPYLQTLGGYPVATAGLLMAPRGAGTMIAMLIAGRLANRADPRLLMLVGFATIAEFDAANDGLDARRRCVVARVDHVAAGRRNWFRVHSASGHCLRDAPRRVADRWDGLAQPGPQRRKLHRHFRHVLPARAKYPDRPRTARRARHAVQSDAADRRCLSLLEHGHAARLERTQRRDHAAGLDHRLYGRFQAHAGDLPAGRASAAADAATAHCCSRDRTARALILHVDPDQVAQFFPERVQVEAASAVAEQNNRMVVVQIVVIHRVEAAPIAVMPESMQWSVAVAVELPPSPLQFFQAARKR